jgi:hypothetical protein
MKALLIYVLLALCFVETKNKSAYIAVKSPVKPTSTDSIPPGTDIIDFNTRIKPIFVNRCSPCHFSGGKMYARLPFDKDTTIVAHGDGILRRIKDEKENELIRQYIQQQGK